MYLIVNNKMDSQNFRKILKPFRQTIKFWLEKLDATLNIIGFNPEIDNFAIQE